LARRFRPPLGDPLRSLGWGSRRPYLWPGGRVTKRRPGASDSPATQRGEAGWRVPAHWGAWRGI